MSRFNKEFRLTDHEEFYGAAPGKLVGLRYAGIFKCKEIITDSEGKVKELRADWIEDSILNENKNEIKEKKVKSYIHWISESDAIDADVRVFEEIFTIEDPGSKDDFIRYVNHNSKPVIKTAKVNKSLKGISISKVA